MRAYTVQFGGITATAVAFALLIGCATAPPLNMALSQAQTHYRAASNNPGVAQAAPGDLQKAGAALDQALALQKQGGSQADIDHYAYLANQRVAIAQEKAAADAAQASIKEAGARRGEIQLQASQQQAQQAQAQAEAQAAQAAQAQAQASDAARQNAQTQQQNAELQRQLAALNAEQTNRGMVLTLGNVLFDLNESTLKPGGAQAVDKLAAFMQKYPKRNVMIEGYTDSTGSAAYNQDLSKRRADAVRTELVSGGINPQRIVTKGFGAESPVADNATASGRQQNRRVEVVISDMDGTFPQSR